MVDDAFDLEHLPHPVRGVRANGRANGNGHAEDLGIAALRVAASDLASRVNIARVAGLTFGGKRDLYEALGYTRVLQPRDYRDRYKRGGIAARIVEAFPDSTWGNGAEVVEDEDPEITTQLEEDFDDLNQRLGVWSMLQRADVLAGLGPYAVLLIGAKGTLETELPSMSSQEDVLYLSPYGPDEVVIDKYDEEVESPRYGLPLIYHITRRVAGTRSTSSISFDRRVHWTRIIHIADGLLDDRTNGTPRMERVWNDLDNLEKVTGGGSEAFWKRAHQGYHWDIKPDVKITPAEIEKLKQEAEEFEHGLRRTMATRGMDLTALGSDVANFDNPVRALVSLISGATKIPQRILLGSERGELASTQDRENWNDRVNARREQYGTPIARDLVDRLIEHGALPQVEEYNIRWPEIRGLTDQERATVATAWAELNSKAGGAVVQPEEIRDRVLGLDKLDQDQLDSVAEDVVDPNLPKPDVTEGSPIPPPGMVTQESVLNGAQITAATDIVTAVAAGEMPRDAGVAQLEILFNLSHEEAERMMGSAGATFKPTPKPTPPQFGKPPQQEAQPPAGEQPPKEPEPPQPGAVEKEA